MVNVVKVISTIKYRRVQQSSQVIHSTPVVLARVQLLLVQSTTVVQLFYCTRLFKFRKFSVDRLFFEVQSPHPLADPYRNV